MTYPLKNWEKAKRGYVFGQKTFYSSRHLGVDHIVPEGTSVYAPLDCEIVFSGTGVQGGNTIWVKFSDEQLGWLVMRCMHLSRLMPKGKYKEGDIIGYTGNTGKFTSGPHLHTDISRQKVQITNFKNFIDPEKYFLERAKNKIKI